MSLSLHLQRCYFQIHSNSKMLGVTSSTYTFEVGGGHNSIHNREFLNINKFWFPLLWYQKKKLQPGLCAEVRAWGICSQKWMHADCATYQSTSLGKHYSSPWNTELGSFTAFPIYNPLALPLVSLSMELLFSEWASNDEASAHNNGSGSGGGGFWSLERHWTPEATTMCVQRVEDKGWSGQSVGTFNEHLLPAFWEQSFLAVKLIKKHIALFLSKTKYSSVKYHENGKPSHLSLLFDT